MVSLQIDILGGGFMEKNTYDRINLLRIMAFFMVFFLHAKLFVPVPWYENVKAAWILYTPAWAGVWIFFLVSGYGIGAGFYKGKYELTLKGVLKYYYLRLIRLIPIYWLFIGIVLIFIRPEYLLPGRNSLAKICSLLFFNYQEEFDGGVFGQAWYLTTLFRLYLVAPIFFYLKERYLKNKKIFVPLFLLLVIGGMFMRIAMGYHISLTGEEWHVAIYKPFYFNLDLFFGGFLLNELKHNKKERKPIKVLPWIVFIGLVLYNCNIYFRATYVGDCNKNIYCYLLPTAYLLVCTFIIYNYDINVMHRRTRLSPATLRGNILRIIDYLVKILMPLYLFHSTVLLKLQDGYIEKWYLYAVQLLHAENYQNFVIGCIYTILAFIIVLIFAVVVHNFYYEKAYSMLYCLGKNIYHSYGNRKLVRHGKKKAE